ncbi:MAG: hypothetical protein JSS02_08935, partial [Planctomycetes bacterium]|nr:hypothetical protein [Planctomycetota bacterium]
MNRPLRLQTTVEKRAALAWLVAATLAMVPRWAAAQGARPGKPSPPSAKNAPAATPSTPLTLWRAGTQTVRSQVADIEAVQMLTAVIGGSQ